MFAHKRGCDRRGFAVGAILYILMLTGVMSGVLFSNNMQLLKSNVLVQNRLTIRSDLQAASNTLSAEAVFGTDNQTLCPPRSVHQLNGNNCATAPIALVDFADVSGNQLPSNYASAASSGASSEVGVFVAGAGLKQLDPYGHYYIYCRWENPRSTPAARVFVLLSAGQDGVLQTACGDGAANGDDALVFLTVGEAINRATLWQADSQNGISYGATGSKLTVDANGNLTTSGSLTASSSALSGTLSANSAAITSGLTAATITTTGDVGIGTMSPAQTLEVNGIAQVDTGLITPKIYPASDSTTALQITKADGSTNIMNVDTTNSFVGIGTTSPTAPLTVVSSGATHTISATITDISGKSAIRGTTAGNGYGVYGSDGNMTGAGVYGTSPGWGVRGASTNGGYAIYGSTSPNSGWKGGVGVYGEVTGANKGQAVQAVNNSMTGWGIYSSGTSPNYFAGAVGIGTTSPQNALDISNGGGIHITSGTPSSTAAVLYSDAGTLMWNGAPLLSSTATIPVSSISGIVPVANGGTGLSGLGSVGQCLQVNSSETALTYGPCSTSPGGSPGQVQFNNAGSFGGFTVDGDGTLDTTIGLLTVTKTNGVAFGVLATLGAGTGLVSSGGNLNLAIPVAVANGGTGLTSYAAHSALVATGPTTISGKVLPNCIDTSGQHLNYNQATDTFSCGTSSNVALPSAYGIGAYAHVARTTQASACSNNPGFPVAAGTTITPTDYCGSYPSSYVHYVFFDGSAFFGTWRLMEAMTSTNIYVLALRIN